MKKIIVFIALLAPLATFAQLDKGRSVISGSFSYNASGERPDDQGTSSSVTKNFSLSATYAYMFGYRWAIGVTPSFQGTSQAVPGSKSYFRSINLSPFVRHYFPVGEKLFLHLDLGGSPTFSRNWTVLNGEKSPETKSTGMNFFLTPGASYFITSRVAVQASLGGVTYGTSKAANSNVTNWSFGSGFGFSSLQLGAALYL